MTRKWPVLVVWFVQKYGYNVLLSGNVEKISFCPEIGIYKKGFNSYFFCKTEGLRGKDEGWWGVLSPKLILRGRATFTFI
jgi:hypothetical protein